MFGMKLNKHVSNFLASSRANGPKKKIKLEKEYMNSQARL